MDKNTTLPLLKSEIGLSLLQPSNFRKAHLPHTILKWCKLGAVGKLFPTITKTKPNSFRAKIYGRFKITITHFLNLINFPDFPLLFSKLINLVFLAYS